MTQASLLVLKIRQAERLLVLGAQQLLQGGGGGGLLFLHVDVAIGRHAGAGGDQPADDDVFLQATQIVHTTGDGGFGEYPRRLLERRRGDKRLRRQRRLRDAQQQRPSVGRLAA